MSNNLRKVDYFYVMVPNTAGQGAKVLAALAGEGVNLQNANLMVNYDLPWNPNRLEQRFGRIHRIGQTEVCHLWNLVAEETREGDVYRKLKALEAESLRRSDAVKTAILRTLDPGDHVIIPTDAYGGTFRLVARVHERHGIGWTAVDLRDADAIATGWRDETRLVWIETPTNPLLSVVDMALWPTTGRVEVLGATYGRVDAREHRRRIGLAGSAVEAAFRDDLTPPVLIMTARHAATAAPNAGQVGSANPTWPTTP